MVEPRQGVGDEGRVLDASTLLLGGNLPSQFPVRSHLPKIPQVTLLLVRIARVAGEGKLASSPEEPLYLPAVNSRERTIGREGILSPSVVDRAKRGTLSVTDDKIDFPPQPLARSRSSRCGPLTEMESVRPGRDRQ